MPTDTIEILLVEDNPADIRLARETLKECKIQNTVHVVLDGAAALSYLRQEGVYANARVPDMVLLDVALPKVDGVEVLRQIREHERLRDIPVVIMTVSNVDEQMFRSLGVEPDCCILKPLTLERFLDAVRCFPKFGLSIVRIASAFAT